MTKIQPNPALLEQTKRQAWLGREPKDSLSRTEREVFGRTADALSHALDKDRTTNAPLFIRAMTELYRESNSLYERDGMIGSFEYGRILAICLMGIKACNWERRVNDSTLLGLTTKLALPFGANLDGLVAGVIYQLLNDRHHWQVSDLLDSLRSSEREMTSDAMGAETTDDWLHAISRLLPYLDGQMSLYGGIIHLVESGRLDSERVDSWTSLKMCHDESRRLDEAIAHIISPGIEMLVLDPDASEYRAALLELEKERGVGAVRRQTKWDVIRFERPPPVSQHVLQQLESCEDGAD